MEEDSRANAQGKSPAQGTCARPTTFNPAAYLAMHKRAMEERSRLGCRSPRMRRLYDFWVAFLPHSFNEPMYSAFKRLAEEDASEEPPSTQGLAALFAFFLTKLQDDFSLEMYQDFETLALRYQDYLGYEGGMQQLCWLLHTLAARGTPPQAVELAAAGRDPAAVCKPDEGPAVQLLGAAHAVEEERSEQDAGAEPDGGSGAPAHGTSPATPAQAAAAPGRSGPKPQQLAPKGRATACTHMNGAGPHASGVGPGAEQTPRGMKPSSSSSRTCGKGSRQSPACTAACADVAGPLAAVPATKASSCPACPAGLGVAGRPAAHDQEPAGAGLGRPRVCATGAPHRQECRAGVAAAAADGGSDAAQGTDACRSRRSSSSSGKLARGYQRSSCPPHEPLLCLPDSDGCTELLASYSSCSSSATSSWAEGVAQLGSSYTSSSASASWADTPLGTSPADAPMSAMPLAAAAHIQPAAMSAGPSPPGGGRAGSSHRSSRHSSRVADARSGGGPAPVGQAAGPDARCQLELKLRGPQGAGTTTVQIDPRVAQLWAAGWAAYAAWQASAVPARPAAVRGTRPGGARGSAAGPRSDKARRLSGMGCALPAAGGRCRGKQAAPVEEPRQAAQKGGQAVQRAAPEVRGGSKPGMVRSEGVADSAGAGGGEAVMQGSVFAELLPLRLGELFGD